MIKKLLVWFLIIAFLAYNSLPYSGAGGCGPNDVSIPTPCITHRPRRSWKCWKCSSMNCKSRFKTPAGHIVLPAYRSVLLGSKRPPKPPSRVRFLALLLV